MNLNISQSNKNLIKYNKTFWLLYDNELKSINLKRNKRQYSKLIMRK